MFRRVICWVLCVLVLGVVGDASARVLYSDSFDRPDSSTLGTNDNAMGGTITASWVEVESNPTQHQIAGGVLLMSGGANANSYIDHKFTAAELLTGFTVEFDVVSNPHVTADHWFAIEFAAAPTAFTTGINVNQSYMSFGFLMRPLQNFIIWDGTTRIGLNSTDLIDNSSQAARIRLKFDSPTGYSDGSTATVRVWINDVPVKDLFGTGDSYTFGWQGHNDGLYISIEHNAATREGIDNLVIYDALGPAAYLASTPRPEDKATDVPRDRMLNWQSGVYASQHDVYVGSSFNDVNSATAIVAPAGVYKGRQGESTYVPGGLEFGETYYWRIDEVNKTPDSTVFKGDIWSFTVEPYAYPITPAATTASSSQVGMGPDKTIDGSGLTGDLHDTTATAMWLSLGTQPNWIQYRFDKVYKLYQLSVWNSNQTIEASLGFGAKQVTIEYSLDGVAWMTLASVPEFAKAPGLSGYAANTTVDLGGVMAQHVRLTINSTWGGMAVAGLSEVQFSYIPVQVRMPTPADGAAQVSLDAELNWRPGREATSHELFFGTDRSAVADETVAPKTVTEHNYVPASLDFGTTYYWKVNEIGAASAYAGDLWSFTTQEYGVIDDFESYTDQPGEEIFMAWIDGFTTGLSGSTVGYLTASGGTFGETTVIHGGKQSMPLQYDNSVAPFVSEAERTFDTAQNWTGNGADSLVVNFRGLAPAFAETVSGGILMNAIGTDIWSTSDQFRYAYKSLTGDGSIVARVDSLIRANAWSKAGVMIRESLDAGSRHVGVVVTPDNGVSFLNRPDTGQASVQVNQTGPTAPYWVKLTRKGNVFSAARSDDGVTWVDVSATATPVTVTMTAPTVYIGLALTSHDAAIETSAAFSNITTSGNVGGSWQVAEIGATQPEGNSVEGLYLTVKDSSGKTKTAQYSDSAATAYLTWQTWTIPLSDFTSAGVKMTAVKSLTIGVGSKAAPKAGGSGTVYIDDIGYGKAVK